MLFVGDYSYAGVQQCGRQEKEALRQLQARSPTVCVRCMGSSAQSTIQEVEQPQSSTMLILSGHQSRRCIQVLHAKVCASSLNKRPRHAERLQPRAADTWFANGTESVPNTAAEGNPNAGSWQPVWDAWQRFIEPLASQARARRPPGKPSALSHLSLLASSCMNMLGLHDLYSMLQHEAGRCHQASRGALVTVS